MIGETKKERTTIHLTTLLHLRARGKISPWEDWKGPPGGMGNPEPGQGVEVPKSGKSAPLFNSTNILPVTKQLPTDQVRDNMSSILHPQIPEYSVLQTSMQAMTEGLLKTILKEGVMRKDTPKLPVFTGKASDEKISWRRWELQVKGLEGVYEDRAIKEAMNKAPQGDAAIVADSLEDNCTWKDLLTALKAKFAVITSMDVMMRTFFPNHTRNRKCFSICNSARKSAWKY